MLKRIALAGAVALAGCGTALADFSYDQTSKITGGVAASLMKVAGAFSKQAREPMRSTIIVKGDRMATITGDISAQIIDLSKQTITEVNFQKRTYWVMTFAEWSQMMQDMTAKAKNEKNEGIQDMTVKASVKDTGLARQMSGYNARNMVLTIVMEGTDSKTGKRGTFMTVTADMWLAKVAGYQEVRNFHQRMAQQLSWSPNMGMLASQPGSEKAMAEMVKEMAKLDGVPVFTLTKMGLGDAVAQQQAGGSGETQAPPQRQEQQVEPEKPSVGGALGKLGGRFGGLGGFGRKKKQDEQAQPQAQTTSSSSSASSGSTQQAGGPPSFMEMTSELNGFSGAAADASKLEVPAGFKQVESERLKRSRK
jgi:hypothetical protein